jgi:hypothetical protein
MSLYVLMLLVIVKGGSQLEVTVPYEVHRKEVCEERGPIFARAVFVQYRENLINVRWKCVPYGDAI